MSKYHITDHLELKTILFEDYQLIKKMKAPIYNRSKMLSTLFSINPNSWRVIGITPAALEVFKKNSFRRVSGMGINRSHITQRGKFYLELLETEFNSANEFWQTYYDNDMTILATSTENMSKNFDLLANYYPVPIDQRNLFRTAGFAWKHKEEEEDFLKEIYKQHQLNLHQ